MWSESQPVSELAGAPDGRVDGRDDADLGHARAVRGEVERRESPGERVVQVVDEAGLRAGAQHRVAEGRASEGGAKAARDSRLVHGALLALDVGARVADEEDRDRRAEHRDDGRADPDDRARRERRRERAGRECGGGDAEVAGRLVQPEREPAPRGPTRSIFITTVIDQARPWFTPRKRLAATIQPQLGSERDQERNGQGEQPAEDEQALAPDAVGEPARGEVRERLGDPEGDDEGEDRALRGEPEVVLADERKHAPLEPDHRADEGVQGDEQGELPGVRAKPEANRLGRSCRAGALPRRLAATIAAWSAGGGGRSTSSACAKLASSRVREGRVVAALEADGRERIARERRARRRSRRSGSGRRGRGRAARAAGRSSDTARGPAAPGRRRHAGRADRRRRRAASRR